MLYIGCPMWGYKEWVGTFFPPRTPQSDFLRLYSRRLLAVEGNTTFYAIPTAETVARWGVETPPTFRFCFKLPRGISHAPQLDTRKSETLFFTQRMRSLGERLGPMFLQLPPAFAPAHLPQLEAFLDFWPADFQLAVEVRHPKFYEEEQATILDNLLSQHNIARIMMDTRPIRVGSTEEQQVLQAREHKPDLPLHIAITANFAFLRYIGNPHMEVNEPLLDAWAQQLAAWIKQRITIYVFCHCPFEVHSPEICAALYQRVSALVPLPPLPWQQATNDTDVQQQRLF
jgi:uncharacterized protein YecE (DUF72 family)